MTRIVFRSRKNLINTRYLLRVLLDGLRSNIPNRVDGKEKDFTPIIEKALEIGDIELGPGKRIIAGLAHDQLSKVSG